MSAQYSYSSGSDSDDDAPEVVSQATARQGRKEQERQARLAKEQAAKARKQAKSKAAASKDVKGKGKAVEPEDEDVDELEGDEAAYDEDEQNYEEDEELAEEDDDEASETIAQAPPQVGKKTTYLDDSLFAEAAAHYDTGDRVPPGQGKKSQRKLAKAEKRRKREEIARRKAQVGEGGQQQVGDITLQHLSTSSIGPASLSSTTLPSHSSAAKFVAKRLYSKKRQVAVLDQGRPQNQERNPKKQKGMSLESKILLGLADPEDANKAKDKERSRKKSLLLQAEGQRKSATVARPLASARRGSKPAANFAVSSFSG
ncbi:hypothetical protein BMF94_6198 [Rhodotorula taiwanensis]|uniref:Uncharacterized protein n=1 Tax=Rhodotorula taiwanensis TaxID=741276 RepID=A0A2S5B1Z6_9BASI|nr:hypothetical protein BMF94_6198 [Rhodotorula taiwanensis]